MSVGPSVDETLLALRTRRAMVLLSIVLAALTVAGCQVARVSTYDPETDRGVTQLQQAIDAHLTNLEMLAATPKSSAALKEACHPDRFVEVYRALNARLRTLTLRNEARDNNMHTVAQLGLLRDNLGNLQTQQAVRYEVQAALPGDRCMGMGQLQVNRNSLEQIIRAILTLEFAKREFREGD